ncbi:MAG: tetratricopeptide repeat protein [Elusimicrobiota bacterium]
MEENSVLNEKYEVLPVLAVVCILILWSALLITKISDADFWWHLKFGQRILETRAMVSLTDHCYFFNNEGYVNTNWLFQVLSYGIYTIMGVNGIILFKLLTLFLAAIVVVLSPGKIMRKWYAIAFFFMVVLSASVRTHPRPEMFSVLFSVLYIFLLEKYRLSGKTAWLYPLPLIQLLWVNLHGFYFMGLLIIICYILDLFAGKYFKLKFIEPWGGNFKILGIAFIAVVAATMINPYGITIFQTVLGYVNVVYRQDNVFARMISELKPTLGIDTAHVPGLMYYKFLVIAVIATFFIRKKVVVSHVLLTLFFLGLSLSTIRGVTLFALVTFPFAAYNLTGIYRQGKYSDANALLKVFKIVSATAMILIILLSLLLTYNIVTNRYYTYLRIAKEFGFGVKPWTYIEGAGKFINTLPPGTRALNEYSTGGYLVWQNIQERKVFIAGFLPQVQEKVKTVYAQMLRAWKDGGMFDEFVEEYKIDVLVLDHTQRFTSGTVNRLWRHPAWKTVFIDETGIVFQKIKPLSGGKDSAWHNEKILDSLAEKVLERYKNVTPVKGRITEFISIPKDLANTGQLYYILGLYEKAIPLYEKTVYHAPYLHEFLFGIGYCKAMLGDYTGAIEYYQKTLRYTPDDPVVLGELDNCNAMLGYKN